MTCSLLRAMVSSSVPEVQIGSHGTKLVRKKNDRWCVCYLSLYPPFHDDCALHSVLFDELSCHPSYLTATIPDVLERQTNMHIFLHMRNHLMHASVLAQMNHPRHPSRISVRPHLEPRTGRGGVCAAYRSPCKL